MKLADIETIRPDGQRHRVRAEEWKARQELACAYRLFDHLGWHSLIFNHITVRVPREPDHFPLQAKTSRQMKNAAGHGNTAQLLFDAMSRWMVDKDPGFLQ